MLLLKQIFFSFFSSFKTDLIKKNEKNKIKGRIENGNNFEHFTIKSNQIESANYKTKFHQIENKEINPTGDGKLLL